jgi:hypothetical protein
MLLVVDASTANSRVIGFYFTIWSIIMKCASQEKTGSFTDPARKKNPDTFSF